MVRILLRSLLAAGITACIGAAATVGFLSLVARQERQTQQPAPPDKQSVSDPPPLAVVIDRSQLE